MAEFFFFGFEVFGVVGVGFDADGDLLGDFEAVTFEADEFAGIVGEEANFFEAEIDEDLGADAVFAQVHAVAELEVRLDGVEARFLELVGFDFGGKTYAAAFLTHVEDDAAARF